ncbi:NAD-dependent epimerase/dehydratase family protein [Sorangium sp. So ce1078]|uniref:NAD-dependent epimerase/dehydratase family protein n=1 Tax=Sorangium sp. So ce1078 TaxID=3133329 RepID=UPI003F60B801
MKVFVTGGSGFVGGHLIEGLVRAGHEVSALARSSRSADVVRRYGAAPVAADLGTLKAESLAGAEAVVHCAAYVEEWGTRAQFWEANVEGTARALEAARAAGVRRFVHVGTEAVLFDGRDLIDVDETHPYPEKQRFLYSETKAEAERRVLAANDPGGMVTVSVRPRFVWGPRDTSVLPVVLRMAREGSFAWLDGGGARTSTTHVANLVHALLLALERGQGGRAYFVADDGTRTMREFLTALARRHGVELPGRSVPSAVALPLATAIEGAWRLLGVRRAPPMTRFAVAMMSRSVTVKTDRARAELGYAPVLGVEEGLEQLAAAR